MSAIGKASAVLECAILGVMLTLASPVAAEQAAPLPGVPATAPAIQNRFFTTSDGVKLHYLEAGPADAQTLVFVPGWTMPAWIFQPQIAAFARTRHVVALDPRAQGRSDIAPSGYDAVRRGQDIGDLIAQLGPRPVVVVAWSLGVLDTLAYVSARGDAHIAGLVLVDNSVGEEPAPTPAGGASHPRSKVPYPDSMRAFVRSMFATPQSQDYLDRLTAASLYTPENVAKALRAYPEPRTFWREAVYSTDKPVLYVVRPRWEAQGVNLVRKHKSAEMAVFEGAGHALFVDQPDRFNALVASFIDRKVGG